MGGPVEAGAAERGRFTAGERPCHRRHGQRGHHEPLVRFMGRGQCGERQVAVGGEELLGCLDRRRAAVTFDLLVVGLDAESAGESVRHQARAPLRDGGQQFAAKYGRGPVEADPQMWADGLGAVAQPEPAVEHATQARKDPGEAGEDLVMLGRRCTDRERQPRAARQVLPGSSWPGQRGDRTSGGRRGRRGGERDDEFEQMPARRPGHDILDRAIATGLFSDGPQPAPHIAA